MENSSVAQKQGLNGQIAAKDFVGAVAYLLRETFEGSPGGEMSAYLDQGVGIFNTLEKLTAEQASREVNGMTIAAQTEHAKFYIDRLCEFINGRTDRVNWDDSWLIETVNEAEWDALRGSVRKAYEEALMCIANVDDWTEDRVGMAITSIAHTAYHLGSIRQIVKTV